MLTSIDSLVLFKLSVALGIGLLVGAERERRKGDGPHRRAAGIRTFAISALCGFVAQSIDSTYLLSAMLLVLGGLTLVSYQHSSSHDPGLTSESAILLTCMLGALSVPSPGLAAILGIVLTALLASRERMHQFVRQVITEQELEDVIVFLAAAMILLPLAPNRFMGPFQAINWHELAQFVVLAMSISAAGYMAKRIMGQRSGMALTGFAGGFVSSTATILSMGQTAQKSPALTHAAAVGAVLSTVSTMVQLGLLISVMLPPLLPYMLLPIGLGITTASLYAWWIARRKTSGTPQDDLPIKGHAFDHKTTLVMTGVVLSVTLLIAALQKWLGAMGMMIGAFVSGFADAHSSVASMSSLVHQGHASLDQAQWGILLAVSSNTLSKAAVAMAAGGRVFATWVLPGLCLVTAAVWLGTLVSPWLGLSVLFL
ncbi:MgtC/SapB family protein [Limnohabitans sp. T6-5]|uniref:MgtC/SapB family protein n=1 Tax=Limnohabitans sp. T6-5 TaxID=1100724 RepID=UPI001304BAB6|nr:MgtC/SapB family protein [Limnohabitans sp. T6-5]